MIHLTRLGFCRTCNQWLELSQSWLPDHNPVGKETKCINSGYSPDGRAYKVKTQEEALTLAEWLKNDDGRCLHSGLRYHSASCADGRDCSGERRMLAQALAIFFLETIKGKTETSVDNEQAVPA